jgi:hypothetical protein
MVIEMMEDDLSAVIILNIFATHKFMNHSQKIPNLIELIEIVITDENDPVDQL